MMSTRHYKQVRKFMEEANQEVHDVPTVPSERTRVLRAKLIMEEALETIRGLGIGVIADGRGRNDPMFDIHSGNLQFKDIGDPDLVEVADGCADIKVVTTGTLISCGIDDEPLQDIIDESNLAKFGEGHRIREDGKLVKPSDWKAPDIQFILDMQKVCHDILHELRYEKRPISYQRLWERLGSPMNRELKVFDYALAYLTGTGQCNVGAGQSNTDRLFYV